MYSESYLFKIEKEIINKYKTFRNIKPLKIIITNSYEYEGENNGEAIYISAPLFLSKNPSKKEVEELITHELIHSIVPGGHSLEFWTIAKRLGVASNYILQQMISEPNKTALEGRFKVSINEKGEGIIKIRKRPSWKGFKELLAKKGGLMYYGVALKRLREINYKTIEDISFITKIPFIKIEEFESKKEIGILTEKEMKQIFKTIILK